MRHMRPIHSVALLGAAVLIAVLTVAGPRTATAQAADAAERCTPDVMRLCSEFIPEEDRIVRCLKAKRKQLSHPCLTALQPRGAAKSKVRRAQRQ